MRNFQNCEFNKKDTRIRMKSNMSLFSSWLTGTIMHFFSNKNEKLYNNIKLK